jgi:hypothetical protein
LRWVCSFNIRTQRNTQHATRTMPYRLTTGKYTALVAVSSVMLSVLFCES